MPTAYTNSVASYGGDEEVTDTYTTPRFPLGSYREEDGVGYRFVILDAGATAAVVGRFAYATSTAHTATATLANGDRGALGVFVSVIPASGYGWIKVRGTTFGTV